jgi:hypothetical protein
MCDLLLAISTDHFIQRTWQSKWCQRSWATRWWCLSFPATLGPQVGHRTIPAVVMILVKYHWNWFPWVSSSPASQNQGSCTNILQTHLNIWTNWFIMSLQRKAFTSATLPCKKQNKIGIHVFLSSAFVLTEWGLLGHNGQATLASQCSS